MNNHKSTSDMICEQAEALNGPKKLKCNLDNRYNCHPAMHCCTLCINNPANGVAALRDQLAEAERERDDYEAALIQLVVLLSNRMIYHPSKQWEDEQGSGVMPDESRKHCRVCDVECDSERKLIHKDTCILHEPIVESLIEKQQLSADWEAETMKGLELLEKAIKALSDEQSAHALTREHLHAAQQEAEKARGLLEWLRNPIHERMDEAKEIDAFLTPAQPQVSASDPQGEADAVHRLHETETIPDGGSGQGTAETPPVIRYAWRCPNCCHTNEMRDTTCRQCGVAATGQGAAEVSRVAEAARIGLIAAKRAVGLPWAWVAVSDALAPAIAELSAAIAAYDDWRQGESVTE